MSITLNRYANGDTNYVPKFNQDADTLESAINGILSSLGSSVSEGPFLNAIFGNSVAFIGSTSYTASPSGTVLTISSGYAWRPDLGTVLYKGSSTAINFSGQAAATYYIDLGADGTPARVSSSSFPLYSVVWTGSAFGTITTLAPNVPGGDISGTFLSMVIAAGAVTLAKMAALPAGTIIGNNTGGSATPLALTPSQVVAMLSAEVTTNKGVANGYASLDSGGKVPTSQLPAAVLGALDYQGTWDASANSPSITTGSASSANKGFYYKVSVAGTTTVDGTSSWKVGDWIVSNGTTWDKVDNYEAVTSVAGLVGAISAAALTGALNLFSSTAQGLVPASGGGTTTYLRADGTFAAVAGASGGTVTSVSLTMPSDFSVSGSPVTGAGTLAVTAANQSANTIKAGPTSGAAAAPTYRALVAADIPALRYDIAFGFPGVPTANQKSGVYVAARPITISHTAPGNAASLTAPTGSPVYTAYKNGSSVGTVTYSSVTGTFSVASDIVLAAGDTLYCAAPATPDATHADIAITFAATA